LREFTELEARDLVRQQHDISQLLEEKKAQLEKLVKEHRRANNSPQLAEPKPAPAAIDAAKDVVKLLEAQAAAKHAKLEVVRNAFIDVLKERDKLLKEAKDEDRRRQLAGEYARYEIIVKEPVLAQEAELMGVDMRLRQAKRRLAALQAQNPAAPAPEKPGL